MSQAALCVWSKTICPRKCYADDVGPGVDRYPLERPCIKRQPQTKRRDVNALAKRIEWLNIYPVAGDADVSAKRLPAKFRIVDYVCRGVERMSEEIWPIVAGVRI